ncbi:MAG: hypothetical protein P8I91_09685, partial [Phycisphaerales bacterium]|nr:hypothetical protein [Phycisphaerales bacterium]
AADGLIKSDVAKAPTEELPYKIKRRFLGGFKVKFNCPSCTDELTADQTDIGTLVACPACHAPSIRVPGTQWLSSRHGIGDAEQGNETRVMNTADDIVGVVEMITDGDCQFYDQRLYDFHFEHQTQQDYEASESDSLEYLETVCEVLSKEFGTRFQVDRSMRKASLNVDLLIADSICIAIVMEETVLKVLKLDHADHFTLVNAWADPASWTDSDERTTLLQRLLVVINDVPATSIKMAAE